MVWREMSIWEGAAFATRNQPLLEVRVLIGTCWRLPSTNPHVVPSLFALTTKLPLARMTTKKSRRTDLAGDVFAERGKLGLARLPPTRPPFQLFPLLFSTSIPRKWMRLAKQGDKLLVNTARVLSPAYLPERDDSTCLKLISPPCHLSFRSLSAFLSHH